MIPKQNPNEGLRKNTVHGHGVYFNPKQREGHDYLQGKIQGNEARIFFDRARSFGKADFESQDGKNWTLSYDRSRGAYRVEPRKRD